jgi:anti-sigma B factor antagonist
MDLAVETSGDTTVITLPGEFLDASNADDLKRTIAPLLAAHPRLVLDMSRLQFVDNSGLGAILSCLRQVNSRGGTLKLCGLSKPVQVLFELVRMNKVFDIHATRDAALRSFQS